MEAYKQAAASMWKSFSSIIVQFPMVLLSFYLLVHFYIFLILTFFCFFLDAAKQSAANSLRNSADAITRKTGITLDEAIQILNVNKSSPMEEVTKVQLLN